MMARSNGTFKFQGGMFVLAFLAFFGLMTLFPSSPFDNKFAIIPWTYNKVTTHNFTQDILEIQAVKTGCKVPKLDPWDSSIQKYIDHPGPVKCRHVQPYLTFMDDNGYVRFNDTEVKLLTSKNMTFVCTYRTIERPLAGADDNTYEFGETTKFKLPFKPVKDAVEVKCHSDNETGPHFYWNVHAHPVDNDELLFASPTEEQLSLLIVLIDSTSHSGLQRNLPLTFNYTKNVMGMKFFTAFNKVGRNSFPNQMAYVTGKRVFNEQEDMPAELPGDNRKKKLDTWPLIWRLFSAKGYETSLNEDWPYWSILHYEIKGFTKKPFDHFFRPFYRYMENAEHKDTSRHCFQNLPISKITFDLTRRLLVHGQDRLQFIWSSTTSSTHQKDNEVEQIDPFLKEFWQDLYANNVLNKTVVLFMSDHGLRLGKRRATLVGWIEEQLPFFSIWFPEWFYKLHPNIKANLEYNTDIFAASFDAYETMRDIFDANYDGTQRRSTSRGQSLLYKLPLNRTCKSAGVPEVYCVCVNNGITLDARSDLALDVAEEVVSKLNSFFINVSNLCQTITMSNVVFLRQINNGADKNSITDVNVTSIQELRIGIETNPFQATFEAMVKILEYNATDEIDYVVGEIFRTSKYEGLSDCVKDNPFLRRYCPCFNARKS